MSTRVTRSKSASSANSQASHLGALPGPALHNILQYACASSNQADLANLLLSSKKLRNEVLACCKGLVQLKYTTAKTASEAETFAQWLSKHGQLASSLSFRTAVGWASNEEVHEDDEVLRTQLAVEAEHNRSLIEAAVAAGLQLAANNSESAGAGLYLQACFLHDAGPNIAAVLQQLPASRLTSLQLEIREPNSNTDSAGTYLRPVRSSLVHLTNLQSLELSFLRGPSDLGYCDVVDSMIKQMSSLTNLTSLKVSSIWNGSVLEDLPASLQNLDLRSACEFGNGLSLGHLTALTNLEGVRHVTIYSDDDLPPNLRSLEVADIVDVEPLLPLIKLEALTLSSAYHAGKASLQKLTVLTALSYVNVGSTRLGDLAGQPSASKRLKVTKQAFAGLPSLRHLVCE